MDVVHDMKSMNMVSTGTDRTGFGVVLQVVDLVVCCGTTGAGGTMLPRAAGAAAVAGAGGAAGSGTTLRWS